MSKHFNQPPEQRPQLRINGIEPIEFEQDPVNTLVTDIYDNATKYNQADCLFRTYSNKYKSDFDLSIGLDVAEVVKIRQDNHQDICEQLTVDALTVISSGVQHKFQAKQLTAGSTLFGGYPKNIEEFPGWIDSVHSPVFDSQEGIVRQIIQSILRVRKEMPDVRYWSSIGTEAERQLRSSK